MAVASTQDAFVQTRLTEIERIDERARRLTGDLPDAQLRWSPPDGGWSIAQVFEHLVTAHSQYLDRMRSAIEDARARGDLAPRGEWRPTLAGGLLIRSTDPKSERKLRAPRSWRPAPEPRADAVEEFLRTQQELRELLHAAEGLDLNRVRTHSPVSRLIRLNLGDCFTILTVHGQRHLRQVERIRQRPDFPGQSR